MSLNNLISVSEEVNSAVADNKPVVALESTIISHGMPYPKNYETAIQVEETVRKNGAVPATIAIINGIIKIGLNNSELEFLSTKKNILKASRRDIPVIVSQKLNAATTVSATMFCASLSSIRIFATGGIGGVHRNAQQTFDVSADLTELARTNVAVISAGMKSILDLPLTLEYLETMGVPVIGYRTNELPAFYSRESGLNVNYKLDTAFEIANTIYAKFKLGLNGGLLIANPIPEKYSINRDKMDTAIEKALHKAGKKEIKGKDITPFLLSQIVKLTKGKSLDANVQLVLNNAKLASEISVELCRINAGAL